MKYDIDITSLDAFYDTLYSIPARLDRHTVTPRSVAEKLLKSLDNPQKKCRSVLITGSKGKGSTAMLLSALINRTGARVGRFSSPHLFDYRERIVVDQTQIDAGALLRIASQVFTAANQLEINHPDEFPRFFEITTAIAYVYFAERYVDVAVIETGIGALTDATNQQVHELSILTHIENEHGDIFGTLEEIATEKSGVLKKDTPLILGDLPENIDQIIIEKAAQLDVPITRFKRQYTPNNSGYYQVKIGEELWITDSMIKAKNGWIALTAFNQLGLSLDSSEKVDVLSSTDLPARQEVVSLKPFVIIDSAHSKESAQTLANYVKKLTKSRDKIFLLLSFSAEKNILPVFSAFQDADTIVLTQATESRSLKPSDVEKKLKEHTKAKIKIIDNPLVALEKTMKDLKPNDVLVITGSVYLAGLVSQQFDA